MPNRIVLAFAVCAAALSVASVRPLNSPTRDRQGCGFSEDGPPAAHLPGEFKVSGIHFCHATDYDSSSAQWRRRIVNLSLSDTLAFDWSDADLRTNHGVPPNDTLERSDEIDRARRSTGDILFRVHSIPTFQKLPEVNVYRKESIIDRIGDKLTSLWKGPVRTALDSFVTVRIAIESEYRANSYTYAFTNAGEYPVRLLASPLLTHWLRNATTAYANQANALRESGIELTLTGEVVIPPDRTVELVFESDEAMVVAELRFEIGSADAGGPGSLYGHVPVYAPRDIGLPQAVSQ